MNKLDRSLLAQREKIADHLERCMNGWIDGDISEGGLAYEIRKTIYALRLTGHEPDFGKNMQDLTAAYEEHRKRATTEE